MVVIDLLTSEAILGLDMLTTCIVDLSHRRLITSAGHEICLKGQNRCKGSVQRLHPLAVSEPVNSYNCCSREFKCPFS